MTKKKARQKKVNTQKAKVIRVVPKSTYDEDKLRKEIAVIQANKEKAIEGKKGFKKFFAGAGYNKELSEKNKVIRFERKIESIGQQTRLAEAQAKLNRFRQSNAGPKKKGVTFDDLMGNSSGENRRMGRLRVEDLY